MEDIFKVIFQLEVENKDVVTSIDEAGKKYGQVTNEVDKQLKKIEELTARESQLLAGRAKATSVTAYAKYNNALAENKKQIDAIKGSMDKVVVTQKTVSNNSQTLSKDLNNAFKTTQVNALSNEVKNLGKEMKNTGDSGHSFETVGNLVRDANGEILATRGNLITLKKALANATDTKDIAHLAEEVGHVKHQLDLSNDAAIAFASGNKFKATGLVFEEIAADIASFNFSGAQAKSELLAEISKKITFKEAVNGVGQLGSTLFNVGKALLTNPIFLIGTAIFAAVEAFESFEKSAERTEETLKSIEAEIKKITDATAELNRQTRDQALQNELDAKRITKAQKEKLDAQNKFKDEYLKIVAETQEAEKKIIEDTKKARDDDGFKATKNILDRLGVETEDTKNQREGLEELQKEHNARILALQKKFHVENDHILIEEANDEAKKRKENGDKYRKFLEDELSLRLDFNKKLEAANNANTSFNIQNRAGQGTNDQLKLQFEEKKVLALEDAKASKEQLDKQIRDAKAAGFLTVTLQKKFAEDRITIDKALNQELINIDQEKDLAIINNNFTAAKRTLDFEKQVNDDILNTSTESEDKKAVAKLNIEQDYFNKSEALLEADIETRKRLGFSTTEQEQQLQELRQKNLTETNKLETELRQKNKEAQIKTLEEQEEHEKNVLKLHNARLSTQLFNDIKYEEAKLDALKKSGEEYLQETKVQTDKVAALQKEAKKQAILEYTDYTETIVNAAVAATSKILDAKIQEVDGQTSLQQKRVDEAKDVASNGNAELLELEKKRLNDLNKEKEKFVRDQQALAAVELIANTAIAVSKAAAEGGAGAAFTIAAALIALVAGLASARSIASQAAFYEGGLFEGEGYTGNGNPREVSHKQGWKPYTYHKEEFIFNHGKTRKYKDYFEGIHNGEIDLYDWDKKVKMFNSFASFPGFNTGANIQAPGQIVQNHIELTELREQMSTLINVVSGQHTEFWVDDSGFHGYVKKLATRQDFIRNNVAKL